MFIQVLYIVPLSFDQFNQLGLPNGTNSSSAFASDGKVDTTFLNFGNAKMRCLVQHCWKYFAFNQSPLVQGEIAPAMVLLMRQNKNIWFYMGGSGLDRTDDFQKFCGSGLDRIQIFQIRIGLGLKNFTVRSSLADTLI